MNFFVNFAFALFLLQLDSANFHEVNPNQGNNVPSQGTPQFDYANQGSGDAAVDSTQHLLFIPPPGPHATPLTQQICRGTARSDLKFFANVDDLFGVRANGMRCDGQNGEVRKDFILPTEAECRDPMQWIIGSKDENNQQCAPQGGQASWTDVPAILGFASPINTACGDTGQYVFGNQGQLLYGNLGLCCMKSGKYYNRLRQSAPPPHGYTFCKNMKWVFCAAAGFLPGQAKGAKGGKIFFPTATETGNPHASPPTTKPYSGKTNAGQFMLEPDASTGNALITIHEFCLLDRICKNTQALWNAPKDSLFECEFDGSAFSKSNGEEVDVAAIFLAHGIIHSLLNHQLISTMLLFAIVIMAYREFMSKQLQHSTNENLLAMEEI